MEAAQGTKKRLALVYGNLPTIEEIDQFRLLQEHFDICVITAESISDYLASNSFYNNLKVVALPDHDENPTYLPGLERALKGFDVVVLKERLGLYAYQAVKAKWRNPFKLVVWIDNLLPFPGQDIDQMRIIRNEVNKAADHFWVQSAAAKQVILSEGVEAERIFQFEPWVEVRHKRSLKARAKALQAIGLKESDYVITHTGQQEWEEGVFELVHAAKVAMSKDASLQRRLKLVFCGVGSATDDLKARIMELGLEKKAVFVAPSREASNAILLGSDALYVSYLPGRDRWDGDPYRLLLGMGYKIPLVASRSPIVEEYIGKHRIDFCATSILGLAAALQKVVEAKPLCHNITAKNAASFQQRCNADRVRTKMNVHLHEMLEKPTRATDQGVDRQIIEIEALVQNKEFVVAIDLIESVFQRPGLALYHRANLMRLIGDCFLKLGDTTSGRNAYLKALEIEPFSAKAHIGLGTVALLKETYDPAVIHFQKAVSLAPEDEMTSLGLGLAFSGLGEKEEAARWMGKSLEINPSSTAAIFSLVKLSYEMQQYDMARLALCRYIELHPYDVNMLFSLAGVEFKSGNIDSARRVAEQILELDPTETRAQTLLAQMTEAQQADVKASMDQ